MNISFKNIPKFLLGGVSGVTRNSNDWYRDIHLYQMLTILDKLKQSGEDNSYMDWLNAMLFDHSTIYGLNKENMDRPLFDELVLKYLRAYSGDPNFYNLREVGNVNGGRYQLKEGFHTNYNLYGIQNAFNNNIFSFSKRRNTGDNPNLGYTADGYFSGITDYRRLLGRKGDYTDEQLADFRTKLNAIGYDIYEDETDPNHYYKLKRLSGAVNLLKEGTSPTNENDNLVKGWEDNYRGLLEEADLVKSWEDDYRRRLEESIGNGDGTDVETGKMKEKFDWSVIGQGLQKIFPGILEAGRLIGNYYNNKRVYGEALKGIRPDLIQSYQTHRQVVGDEATKLAYYRRAALGLTRAALPFTSDADRQMAYLFEAKRIGDELRALGDLADNQEIRRTSDESNQHQWANIQRNTEVANANLKSINYANSLRHNLLSLKHAANWTSFDNYLQGIGYRARQRKAEELALLDLIFALQELLELLNDSTYSQLVTDRDRAVENHTKDGVTDWNHKDIRDAQQTLLNYKILRTIQHLKDRYKRRNISIVKSGGKITHKKKDDLLYKSTKDSVEHFRKMSKLSSDALNRKSIKIEKLTSHPKKTKKYQQGGIAPFTIYKPIALGGETTTSSEYSASSSKSSSKSSDNDKDVLDLVKELFKAVAGKGLPADVNRVYVLMQNLMKKAEIFGTELSTEDIASMYLQLMLSLNTVEYYKNQFDAASKIVETKDAENEFAIDLFGRVAVQNRETNKIEYKKPSELDIEKYNPLTNKLLLNIRATSPGMEFDEVSLQVASNATGKNDIAKFLRENLPKIGLDSLEGYTKQETNLIRQGVEVLKEAPNGDYKYVDKSLLKLATYALNYLLSILPENMKTYLKLHSQDPKELIGSLIASTIGESNEIDAVTGRAAKDANGNLDKGINSNFLVLLLRDLIGVDRPFELITKDDKTKFYSLNSKSISQIPNAAEDMSVNEMLIKSKIGTIMDSRLGVTFGDQIISPENFKDIMFDSSYGALVVTLPCKYENRHKVVNFAIKDEFDDTVSEISKTIPIDYNDLRFIKALANKLHEKGLDSLLNGENLDPNMFGHFFVVSAYTTDKIPFNTSSKYIEKVKNPTKDLEERISQALSSNKDKNDYEVDVNDKWGIFELTYDDVYRGNVFIPLNNDPVSAQTGWGNTMNLDETKELAEQYLNYQKNSKIKETSSSVL